MEELPLDKAWNRWHLSEWRSNSHMVEDLAEKALASCKEYFEEELGGMDGLVIEFFRELERQATSYLDKKPCEGNVFQAMREVERSLFANKQCYTPEPIWVGKHTTLSAPYVVLTYGIFAAIAKPERIYESGSGTGYSIAVLSRQFPKAKVFGSDRDEEIVKSSKELLKRLGIEAFVEVENGANLYRNKTFRENAPYGFFCFSYSLPHRIAYLTRKWLENFLSEGGILLRPVSNNFKGDILIASRWKKSFALANCVFEPMV